MDSKTSISVGHEHINFIHTFNNINEWHTHIKDFRKVDKIIYITINIWKKQINVGLITIKRMMKIEEVWMIINKATSRRTSEIHNILVKEKHKNDIIFPFKYIYKKEYLREWIRIEFDWNDRCYDALYDAWYNKQDVII